LTGARPALARRASPYSAAVLLAALIFGLWLFTPTWQKERGADFRDLYAAASLSSHGGDPYDPSQQFAEEDRLFKGAGVGSTRATYGYPPLFTALLRTALPLGEPAAYVVFAGLLAVAGAAGFELLLAALKRRRRGLARAFFLTSTPMVLSLLVGNPSPVLLLAMAAAMWLIGSRRPWLAGLALSVCLLKLPVGLPAAAAIILAAPWLRTRLALGFAAGTAGWVLLDLALSGPAPIGRWLGSLAGYGSALEPHTSSAFSQSGLAGLPALFLDHVPLPVAVALALIPLVAVAAYIWSGRRLSANASMEPWLPAALLLVMLVGLSPYLHLNDLVLLAFPLLVVAGAGTRSIPGSGMIGNLALLDFSIGAPLRLLVVVALAAIAGYRPGISYAGSGISIVVLTLVALAMIARGGANPKASPEAAPGDAYRSPARVASDRR
jgi:Glycosyltransferase family 87